MMDLYNSFVEKNPNKEDKLMPILNRYLVIKQKEMMLSKEDQNIKNFYENLILPMQNEIIALKSDVDDRAKLIIKEVLNCKKAYVQMQGIRYARRRDVLLSGRRLLEIKELLKNSCRIIKGSKPRFD